MLVSQKNDFIIYRYTMVRSRGAPARFPLVFLFFFSHQMCASLSFDDPFFAWNVWRVFTTNLHLRVSANHNFSDVFYRQPYASHGERDCRRNTTSYTDPSTRETIENEHVFLVNINRILNKENTIRLLLLSRV